MFNRENKILLKELVKTNYKMRYQGSVIGHAWSLIKPLMLFTIMYIVFVYFFKIGREIPHFEVAMLLGMVLWNFFTEATSLSLTSMITQSDLLRKLNFSKQIIVVSIVINALINLGISLVIVLIFMLFNKVQITISILFMPLFIIELILFTLGVSFIVATIYVFFRDLGQIWEVILQLLMYMTPIIYPINEVMKRSTTIAKLLMLNPVSQIIEDIRHIMISDQYLTTYQVTGSWFISIIPYGLSIVTFIIGYIFFDHNENKFPEIV